MASANRGQSPDELVYQSNKQEPDVKEVYSTEQDKSVREVEKPPEAAQAAADANEMSAESFPASDAPASTSTTPEPSSRGSGGTTSNG